MKALLLNGSSWSKGNTAVAPDEMKTVSTAEGLGTERIQVGSRVIQGCIACGKCIELGRYVFDNLVNELAPKPEAHGGLVVDGPVYYASANTTLVALSTRLFYSTPFDRAMKVGAAVTTTRRGGLSSTFDELNKFFTISGTPVVSSQHQNNVHDHLPGEATQDTEGLQTMRTPARNMAFLVRGTALGRRKYGLPRWERPPRTHFIH